MTATGFRDAFEARKPIKNCGDLVARNVIKCMLDANRKELAKLSKSGEQWSASAAENIRDKRATLRSDISRFEALLVSPVELVLQVSRMAGGAEVMHFTTATRDR